LVVCVGFMTGAAGESETHFPIPYIRAHDFTFKHIQVQTYIFRVQKMCPVTITEALNFLNTYIHTFEMTMNHLGMSQKIRQTLT